MSNTIEIVETKYFTFGENGDGIDLEFGKKLAPVTIAYETYGELNSDKSNAILITHALSGDAHVAGFHKGDSKPGWWDNMVGAGKAFDTDKYFVISSNVIGGCTGSTGPASINPKTNKPYGLDFPPVTISDMVKAQKRLVEHLGIKKLLSVAGGSMGGMQALQWVSSYPEMVSSTIAIATAIKHSPRQIAFAEVGRQAIMADPLWNDGNYYGGASPDRGLAIARMLGHITYMSEQSMESKFSRKLKEAGEYKFSFHPEFEVEGYLAYRGDSFVKRFDANSYLYINKAMDYFDLSGSKFMPDAKGADPKFLIIAFDSDWLYPPHQSREIVKILKGRHFEVTFCEIKSTYGHDSFLVEVEEESHLIKHFLTRMSKTYK